MSKRPRSTWPSIRANDGEEFEAVVADIANIADVTPGQVILFVQAVVESQPKE